MLTPNAQRKRIASSGKLDFFQRANGPSPIRKIAGAIKATNTDSKYGGPTEIFPSSSASITNGYNVPSRTLLAATTNSRLFANKRDSLDTRSKLPPRPILGALQANKSNELPITTTKKDSIKIPRVGSVAKA